jgi:hypothetical protein
MPNSRAGACEGCWTDLYTILYGHRSMSSLMNVDHVGDLAAAPDWAIRYRLYGVAFLGFLKLASLLFIHFPL